jgi:hypothetical protein
MTYLIRVALTIVSLATIPSANAAVHATPDSAAQTIQQGWSNG